MQQKKQKAILGWKDKVDFPELDLFNIDAKIDTGAYTSAIHCGNISQINDGLSLKVRFNLLNPSHPAYNGKEFILPVHAMKKVKNSFGSSEVRYQIKSTIILFGKPYKIVLSLSSRGDMRFPVLLGRRLLLHNFLVDVNRKDVSYKWKKQAQKNKSE